MTDLTKSSSQGKAGGAAVVIQLYLGDNNAETRG